MKKLILFFAVISSLCVSAQTTKYDAASIPDSLKKDVSIVKRYENFIYTVNDIDRAILKVHTVYTVLDKNGESALQFFQLADKFTELTEAEIRVYDAFGKQTDKHKKKDFYQRAIGSQFMDDSWGFLFKVSPASYPVTVEYIYEVKDKGTLQYPPYLIISPDESVEYSSFTAKIPTKYDLRYKEKNINIKPIITEQESLKIYNWTVKNLKPIKDEEGSVDPRYRYPAVFLAPNKFKMDDFEGDMSSWKNFGLWEASLLKGLDILPEERKKFFKELVKNANTDREKVQIAYKYLQDNFRYVSIQLGIGGWKPLAANFTDSKKYGDCKGLSFYLHSVLKTIGITSYTALINSEYNYEPVDPEFPMNQFNHMILCVPNSNDTIWLECTSNTIDFGVLGTGSENKNALLITESGGQLVPTPKSNSKDHQFHSTSIATIAEDGSGECISKIKTGGQYKLEIKYLLEAKKDDQKVHIVHRWGYKQPDEFGISKEENTADFGISVALKYEKIPEFSTSTKMFLKPQLYSSLLDYKLPRSENRKLDYYFEKPFEAYDTTIYKLPQGYGVDALPQEKRFSCDYGDFTSKYWFDENEKAVKSATTVVLKHHIIPAAKYAQVKTFFDAVYKEASQRIVIKKI